MRYLPWAGQAAQLEAVRRQGRAHRTKGAYMTKGRRDGSEYSSGEGMREELNSLKQWVATLDGYREGTLGCAQWLGIGAVVVFTALGYLGVSRMIEGMVEDRVSRQVAVSAQGIATDLAPRGTDSARRRRDIRRFEQLRAASLNSCCRRRPDRRVCTARHLRHANPICHQRNDWRLGGHSRHPLHLHRRSFHPELFGRPGIRHLVFKIDDDFTNVLARYTTRDGQMQLFS